MLLQDARHGGETRRSEVGLASVLDALSDCVAVLDGRGVVRHANAALRRLGGDSSRFSVGSDFVAACEQFFERGEERATLERGLREVLAGRRQHLEIDCPWRAAAGGRFRTVIARPCSVSGERGAIAQAREATDCTTALADLRESEARYRTLVDGSPDIVFITDASSRSACGLGLGLFISRQIVEAHGGSIDVESLPGGGACFRVRLPIECATCAAEEH